MIEKPPKNGYETTQEQMKVSDADLESVGLRRDEEGKIVLYHATFAKHYIEILKTGMLLPASKTSNRLWRLPNEEGNTWQKIYLANSQKAENISENFSHVASGSIVILEVHVDEANLRPDEDTEATTWIESMKVGDEGKSTIGRSCSHLGPILNFRVFKRMPFQLSNAKKAEYVERDRANPEKTEEIYKEFLDEIERLAREEEKQMEEAEKMYKDTFQN